ncbi:MAG: sugar transferase [Bifidobacteriaceae bacterium]|jgi:exopolysaccharide biosynthesis polyprenyl glycosylphosphotransferase|nr:sugar transferase [Bifidobacteriaceae bacterium]
MSTLARAEAGDQSVSGLRPPRMGAVYYVVGSALLVVMIIAIVAPRWALGPFHSTFRGLVADDRPWRELIADLPTRLWVLLALLGWVVSSLSLMRIRWGVKAVAHQAPLTLRSATGWRRVYSHRLALTDFMSVTWAVLGAQLIWFGSSDESALIGAGQRVAYPWISLVVVLGWMAALEVASGRDPLLYGEGPGEYSRVAAATFAWFGMVAIMAMVWKIDLARGYILLAFPLGLVALVVDRKMWRSWLVIKRGRQGLYTQRAVVIGSASQAETVANELTRSPAAGYSIQAIALPSDEAPPEALYELGVPIVTFPEAVTAMRASMADSLIIAGGESVDAALVRELSWELEPGVEHLVMAPNLLDVAGPRLAARPVAGLNLLHVETPRFTGPGAKAKRVFDVVASGLGLLILLVPGVVLAILIKVTSKGPVFYRQVRVGLHGSTFGIWKFRSMVADADQHVDHLHQQRDAGNEVLFKIKDDPRITGVGRWMRRFSLDETPQLLNVFRGSMSLVGPRPPLPEEVDHYTEEQVTRRFLVRPGITGLWQVSGRSDLSWTESIRLDLYYVENWTFIGDLQLLFRTFKVVVAGHGAY